MRVTFICLFVLIAASLGACTPGQRAANVTATSVAATSIHLESQMTPVSGGPQVTITSSLAGLPAEVGQRIEIQVEAIDTQGISRIELLANDQVVSTDEFVPQPNATLVSKLSWQPDSPGEYTLQARAYNPANAVGQSEKVSVQVDASVAPADTPTPTDFPSPTPPRTPTVRVGDTLATATPAESPNSTAVETATPTYPYLIVQISGGLNVRVGPSTQYQTLGVLTTGESAKILGQNNIGSGRWWQIGFAPAPDGVGWVSASTDYSRNFNTDNVPTVDAPALAATPPPPTQTPTPPAEAPAERTDIVFRADRIKIDPGECVTVYWDVVNAKEVYYRNQGVPGNDQSRTECPTLTETYELRVVKPDGQTERFTVRIEVVGAEFAKAEMELGEGIDFDEDGEVSDEGDDFKWVKDGDERKIEKWDDDKDLKLVPIGPVELEMVSLTDCRWALDNIEDRSSMEPFPGLAACFRTDEGRIGKMRFDEVDDDADIEWALWN